MDDMPKRDSWASQAQLVFNCTVEGIWTIGLDGCITAINPSALRMLGYTDAQQVLGQNSHEQFHHSYADGSHYPQQNCPIFHAFQRGTTAHLENEVLWRADGTSFYADYRSVPAIEDGAIVGSVVTFTDNTENNRIKKELATQRGILDSQHAQLAESVTTLQQERDIRERFVNALSHDLRTPLSAAKLCAQVLKRKKADPEAVETLADRIVASINRSERMVTDLLDANRLKAGEGIPLTLADCELNHVVGGAVKELNSLNGDRFRLLRHAEGIEGHWDAAALQRVVENLGSNAAKYGAEDGVVTIKTHKRDDAIEISVHNEGNPISPEDQKDLFKNFHRTVAALASGRKGWGIGLTLVKGLVEAHCGSVHVESNPKLGTTFSVKIPLDVRIAK